jgi:ATP-dependent exoDNAse (exonuclease V) alpha subunit
MDAPEHVFKKYTKWEQILLNPAFCLTDYKAQGQTYDKLIVDLYINH